LTEERKEGGERTNQMLRSEETGKGQKGGGQTRVGARKKRDLARGKTIFQKGKTEERRGEEQRKKDCWGVDQGEDKRKSRCGEENGAPVSRKREFHLQKKKPT